MVNTNNTLDATIAQYIANPKLGDAQWEREWSDLMVQKHSKARVPTVDELARAFAYLEREYYLDGTISAEQWAEGLAFSRYPGDSDAKQQAAHMVGQLSTAEWLRIAERANYLSREQCESPRYVK